MSFKGLVHIYYGDGKSKSCGAFGLVFRCAGRGHRVVAAQFLKGRESGEVLATERFEEITVLATGMEKFTFSMTDQELEELRKTCLRVFRDSVALAEQEPARLLVLDEVIDACVYDFLPIDELVAFLKSRPPELEIVLTGHSLPEWLSPFGDYISNVRKEKHPFDLGINGRESIEY